MTPEEWVAAIEDAQRQIHEEELAATLALAIGFIVARKNADVKHKVIPEVLQDFLQDVENAAEDWIGDGW